MSNCAGLAQGGQEAILPCHLGVHSGLDALQEPDGSDGDECRWKIPEDLGVTVTSAPEDNVLSICLCLW